MAEIKTMRFLSIIGCLLAGILASSDSLRVDSGYAFYFINGELKPDIRTPEINKLIINTNKQ